MAWVSQTVGACAWSVGFCAHLDDVATGVLEFGDIVELPMDLDPLGLLGLGFALAALARTLAHGFLLSTIAELVHIRSTTYPRVQYSQ